ncbi:MAG TPA: menaquinone biosynthesis protein, partial [Candidatus Angelobacter sp.]|nr:menaquinone biosynthesis protein [Candidatus Angelobacter sp.]
MPPLRISAISFLNTAPLMWDFENGDSAARLRQNFEISYTIPSHCAEQLKQGSADIGIIPVAAYTEIPDLVIVPDVAIAAKNKVRSILLVSKTPLEKIRSVATDDSSRTSAALVEIYLRKFVGTDAGFIRQKPNLKEMLRWHDAALLIGDPALQARTDGYHVYDLAEEWRRWTGRPFVFAFWAVRKAALQGRSPGLNIARVFQQSRDHGLRHIPEIAAAWAPKLGLSAGLISNYLTENVDYSLDSENLEGLQLFFRYGAELGIFSKVPELELMEQAVVNPATR